MKRRRSQAKRKPTTDYAVGYGRPPAWTRFRPGQSGNAKGRPKGARNAVSMARDALERTIDVAGNGTHRKMTVREVAYQRLAEKAVSGDMKALNFLLTLENEQHQPGFDQSDAHTSTDRALEIVQAFLERQRAGKGEKQ